MAKAEADCCCELMAFLVFWPAARIVVAASEPSAAAEVLVVLRLEQRAIVPEEHGWLCY